MPIELEAVLGAIKTGSPIDFAPDLSNSELLADVSKDWPAERGILATTIRAALVKHSTGDPRGLTLRGIRIVGTLDLDWLHLAHPLRFIGCQFETTPRFVGAELMLLDLTGSILPGCNLDDARIANGLLLDNVICFDEFRLVDSAIGGEVRADSALFVGQHGSSVCLDRATLESGINFHGSTFAGIVSARYLKCDGQFRATSARFRADEGIALALDGANIRGSAIFDGTWTMGAIALTGATLHNQLSLSNTRVRNPRNIALTLDQTKVFGSVFLDEMLVDGMVTLAGLDCGGDVTFQDTQIVTSRGPALVMSNAAIQGALRLVQLEAIGDVIANGISVNGALSMSHALLSNISARALNLENATINGNVFMREFRAVGEVAMFGVTVGGMFEFYPHDESSPPFVLLLENGTFSGRVVLGISSRIEKLSLANSIFHSSTTVVTDLEPAAAAPLVFDAFGAHFESLSFAPKNATVVDLTQSVIARIELEGTSKIATFRAQGWTLGLLQGRLSRADLAQLLGRSGASEGQSFADQPWKELARAIELNGEPETARWLRWRVARRTTRSSRWYAKPLRWVYGALVGYGYYPAISFAWIVALWAVVFLLSATNASAFVATDPSVGTTFSPALFAVDTALPIAATGESAAWVLGEPSWLDAVFVSVKTFSWALTAFLLAGITGILRKD